LPFYQKEPIVRYKMKGNDMSKSATAKFFINELRYDKAERKDIIAALVEELSITKANAAAYIYNFDKKAR
jgi:hypothetical protein